MSLPLVLRRRARAEFDKAFDWYEDQRPGLGVRFAGEARAVFDRIAESPEQHAVVHREIRRVRMSRFPYSVYYRIRGDQVVVLAVYHDKRDPKGWQSRT